MRNRILALLVTAAGAIPIYFWEFIRSQVYEKLFHMAPRPEPWMVEQAWRYGPALIPVSLGLYLFWRTRPARPRMPLQIFFDPANPGRKFWSIEPLKDKDG